MRYTRNRQRRLLKSNARIGMAKGYARLGKNIRIEPRWYNSIDPEFVWLRIEYEGDKKVYNFWGIRKTYARKIK